jgi:hypothetical protein
MVGGASQALTFAVRVDSTLPSEVTEIVNDVVINDNSGTPPGQGTSTVRTPVNPPTGLDETEEPTLDQDLFLPLIQR